MRRNFIITFQDLSSEKQDEIVQDIIKSNLDEIERACDRSWVEFGIEL